MAGTAAAIAEAHVVQRVREQLLAVGYEDACLEMDYRFVNYLEAELPTCEIPLIAFGSPSRDYRSACVALSFQARAPKGDIIGIARAAGAQRSLIVGEQGIEVFDLHGAERRLAVVPEAEIGVFIGRDPDLWRPENVLRAKGMGLSASYQVRLGEHLGWVPLLDREIAVRLQALFKELFTDLDRQATGGRARIDFPPLVKLVLWLVTAATLMDRRHPSASGFKDTAEDALKLAAFHNGLLGSPQEDLGDRAPLARRPDIQKRAWERIRTAPYFRNLPADVLAHLYEDVLVGDDVRKKLSIHATPRWLTELAAELVPWEDLATDRQRVVELCAGHGPFLLSCIEPLRRLHAKNTDGSDGHRWLVERLRGVELEAFALEVSRLALTAAVYPDGNGWDLRCADVFGDGVVESAVADAGVVLCNPPFELAKGASDSADAGGPEALVTQILKVAGPVCLVLLLPCRMVEARGSPLHELLSRRFARLDVVLLPDRVFSRSDAETALIVASQTKDHTRVTLRTARIDMLDRAHPPRAAELRWESASRTVEEVHAQGTVLSPMQALWQRLRNHPRLGDVAELHRGIEFNRSLRSAEDRAALLSSEPRLGWSKGVYEAEDLRALRAPAVCYLNTDPGELRCAALHPWNQPKILLNAARVSRRPWCNSVSIDHGGIWAYQRLVGVWPREPSTWSLEVLAAVLSGPIAATYLHFNSGKRDLQVACWRAIPLPLYHALDHAQISSLVASLADLGDADIPAQRMMEIDALVLEGYRLPARLERDLLRFFDDHPRKGVADFSGYPGRETGSAYHLKELLGGVLERSTPERLLQSLPIYNDPSLAEFLSFLPG